jgi:hypothetical protein
MSDDLQNLLYDQFVNKFVKPYNMKKKEGGNFKEEEQMMIEKYIKYSMAIKNKIKKELPKLWDVILNPAFIERSKRKEGLKEEEMKLKDSIKKEAKKKV